MAPNVTSEVAQLRAELMTMLAALAATITKTVDVGVDRAAAVAMTSADEVMEKGLHPMRQQMQQFQQQQAQMQQQLNQLMSGHAPGTAGPSGPAGGPTGGREPGRWGQAAAATRDREIPNSGRGGAASTSGWVPGAGGHVDRRAVIIKLPEGMAPSKALSAMEAAVNKALSTSPDVGRFAFRHVRGLGKEGEEKKAQAEAASASGAATAATPAATAAAPAPGGSEGAADAAAAQSSGAGAKAQARPQLPMYQVVAWFAAGWADGSGFDELISTAKKEGKSWGWVVKDYLTIEGKRARQAQQPYYTQLAKDNRGPTWRNGAEIWLKSENGLVLYRRAPAHGEQAAGAAGQQTPDASHPGTTTPPNGDTPMGDAHDQQ